MISCGPRGGGGGGGAAAAALARTWMALNDSRSEFSLQNCRMILITLHKERGRQCWKRQADGPLAKPAMSSHTSCKCHRQLLHALRCLDFQLRHRARASGLWGPSWELRKLSTID